MTNDLTDFLLSSFTMNGPLASGLTGEGGGGGGGGGGEREGGNVEGLSASASFLFSAGQPLETWKETEDEVDFEALGKALSRVWNNESVNLNRG